MWYRKVQMNYREEQYRFAYITKRLNLLSKSNSPRVLLAVLEGESENSRAVGSRGRGDLV